jgi:hypothetical protein
MFGGGELTASSRLIVFDYACDVNGLAFRASHDDLISCLESSYVLNRFDRFELHKFAGATFGGPCIGAESVRREGDDRCKAADRRDQGGYFCSHCCLLQLMLFICAKYRRTDLACPLLLHDIALLLANHQHRTRRVTHDPFCDAAEECVFEPGAPMS